MNIFNATLILLLSGFADCTDSETELEKTCPVYKNILPSGQCIEYLKNVRVAACLRASERDDLHRRFHSYYLPTLKFLLKEGLLLETILHNVFNCGNKTELKHLLKPMIDVLNIHDLDKCYLLIKKAVCLSRNPVCLVARMNGTEKTVISPLCRESIQSLMLFKACFSLESFLKVLSVINERCQINTILGDVLNVYNITQHPPSNMLHIERCQLYISDEIKEVQFTVACYEGIGLRYNGSAEISVNSMKCLPWNLNPYLNVEVYPNLIKNFCRNPQGYGKKPWCYVDYYKGIWEYCDIQVCENDKGHHVTYWSKYKWLILLGVSSILLLAGITCIILWRKRIIKKDEMKSHDADITPYNTTRITGNNIIPLLPEAV